MMFLQETSPLRYRSWAAAAAAGSRRRGARVARAACGRAAAAATTRSARPSGSASSSPTTSSSPPGEKKESSKHASLSFTFEQGMISCGPWQTSNAIIDKAGWQHSVISPYSPDECAWINALPHLLFWSASQNAHILTRGARLARAVLSCDLGRGATIKGGGRRAGVGLAAA